MSDHPHADTDPVHDKLVPQPDEILVDKDGAYCAVFRGFISPDEQQALYKEMISKLTKCWPIVLRGKKIMQPRLNWGCGDSHVRKHHYSGGAVDLEDWTTHVKRLNQKINVFFQSLPRTAGFCTDSCLVNGYRDQSDSIGWHSDKETTAPYHIVATVSVGASRSFSLFRKVPGRPNVMEYPQIETTLHGGDLCLMWGRMQELYKHAVLKSRVRCGMRMCFTFRQLNNRPSPQQSNYVTQPSQATDVSVGRKRRRHASITNDDDGDGSKRSKTNAHIIDLTSE
jgi:alkylated DNA repair dioxygenase AlkB